MTTQLPSHKVCWHILLDHSDDAAVWLLVLLMVLLLMLAETLDQHQDHRYHQNHHQYNHLAFSLTVDTVLTSMEL